MAIARDDRWLSDGLGRALAGAQVYWCTQPASTADNPPSPLATIYTDLSGDTPITQPVITDGFGHAYAYMDDTVLYTVVFWHPLFGSNPVVLQDQTIGGGGGGGGSTYSPFQGVPSGTIDGTNKTFQLQNGSTPLTVLPTLLDLALNGVQLTLGLGYTIALTGGVATVTLATAPQPPSGGNPGDSLYAQGWTLG